MIDPYEFMGVSHFGVILDTYNGNVSHQKRVKFDKTRVHDKNERNRENLKSDRTQKHDGRIWLNDKEARIFDRRRIQKHVNKEESPKKGKWWPAVDVHRKGVEETYGRDVMQTRAVKATVI